MVTVKFGPDIATVEDGTWESENEALAALLNAMWPAEGFSGAQPDPDFAAAQEAAEKLGGVIESADEVPYDPEAVY